MHAFGFPSRVASMLDKIGGVLLRGGELNAAAMAYGCAARFDPEDISAHLSLSALQHFGGQPEKARETLIRGIRNKPFYVRPCPTAPLGDVLTAWGIDAGHYMIQRHHNNDLKIEQRGANFSTRYLIDKEKYSIINFFINEDNLLHSDNLPPFDVIVNTISDPDREPQALRTLKEFMGKNPDVPVINHPDRVAETTRDANYRRFKDWTGILFPNTVRVAGETLRGRDVLRAMDENGLSFPVLVREAGSHNGQTLRKMDIRDDIEGDFPYGSAREIYVTQYVECRHRDAYFRKIRVFFIDGKIFPVVCHIDTVWKVHGNNRRDVMLNNPWMMDEEEAFVTDPRGYLGERQYALLRGFHDEIGLDFFGVDFTVTADGTILIFELNPVMRHSFVHGRHFPYLVPHLEKISEAFSDMIARRVQLV